MILDSIKNLKRYNLPKIDAILKFITRQDCAKLPDGEMEIQGRELFVRVMNYTPKPALENNFETHQIYADVQYVVSGAELMQIARLEDLTPLTAYDPVGDLQFYKSSGVMSNMIVKSGEFALFFPNQAHRPSCLYEGYEGPVKKLVFKVKI